jgi:hypothetical protein
LIQVRADASKAGYHAQAAKLWCFQSEIFAPRHPVALCGARNLSGQFLKTKTQSQHFANFGL